MDTSNVQGSIFPIIYEEILDPGLFRTRGTGFFIDEQGHFLTAGHVIIEQKNLRPVYCGSGRITWESRQPFEIVYRSPSKDVVIGRVPDLVSIPLVLSAEPPTRGTVVTISGYPLHIVKVAYENFGFSGYQLLHQSSQVLATINRYCTRDSVNNRAYLYNVVVSLPAGQGGMSGAPVWNEAGEICGMHVANVSSTQVSSIYRSQEQMELALSVSSGELLRVVREYDEV